MTRTPDPKKQRMACVFMCDPWESWIQQMVAENERDYRIYQLENDVALQQLTGPKSRERRCKKKPMTGDEQLRMWVDGNSVHGEDECCPDFSCCRPELLAPEHERQAFAKADEEARHQMLMGFLGRAIATYKPQVKVHIAGDHGDEQ